MADSAAPDPAGGAAPSASLASKPSGGESGATDPVGTLDTALLETLFYNEMLSLDDPSHTFDMSAILGGNSSEGGSRNVDVASVGDSTVTTDCSKSAAGLCSAPGASGSVSTSTTDGMLSPTVARQPTLAAVAAAVAPPPLPPLASAAPLSSAPQAPSAPPTTAVSTTATAGAESVQQQMAAHAAAMASALPPAIPLPKLVVPQSSAATPSQTLGAATAVAVAATASTTTATAPASEATAASPSTPCSTAVAAAPPAPRAAVPAPRPSTMVLRTAAGAPAVRPQPVVPPPTRPKPTVTTSVTISGGGLPALAVQAATVAARAGVTGPARPRGLTAAKVKSRPSRSAAPQLLRAQVVAPTASSAFSTQTMTMTATQTLTQTSVPPQHDSISSSVTAMAPPQAQYAPPPQPTAAPTASPTAAPQSAVAGPPSVAQAQQARQMVSQFAALASHLGISLPSAVLQSLTAAAQQKMEAEPAATAPMAASGQTTQQQPSAAVAADGRAARPSPAMAADVAASVTTVAVAAGAAATAVAPLPSPFSAVATPMAPAVVARVPVAVVAPSVPVAPTAPPPLVQGSPVPVAAASTLPASAASLPSSATVAPALPPLPTVPSVATSSFVQQLQETAEAAIAAVEENRKRPHDAVAAVGGGGSGTAAGGIDAACPPPPQRAHGNRPLQYRRKKKPRLEDCEMKLAQLRRENETLKRHLSNVTNQSQRFDMERQQAEAAMRELVRKSGALGGEGKSGGAAAAAQERKQEREQEHEQLKDTLSKFTEMYSDYGRRRQDELQFHLEQLERLAIPTTFTKMTLWTMGQGDQFFLRPKSNPIAGILMKELGITPLQGRKIVEHRDRIKQVCANIRQCLVLLGRLKSLCERKKTLFFDRMSKCQEILTPLQVVKLLLWVDEHAGTLESVCPGWGSERIRSGNQALHASNSASQSEGQEPVAEMCAPATAAAENGMVAQAATPKAPSTKSLEGSSVPVTVACEATDEGSSASDGSAQ